MCACSVYCAHKICAMLCKVCLHNNGSLAQPEPSQPSPVSKQLLTLLFPQGGCTRPKCGQSPAPAQPARNPHEVFDALDVDGDGTLSLSELVGKLSQFGLAQDEVEQLFMLLDTNRDGSVDRAEFAAGFAKYEALERGGVSGRELLKVWAAGNSKQLANKVSNVAFCPGQCCPAPAHKVGLMRDEPPRVVFVGCTGSGKSSLCTALTGQDGTAEAREASAFKIGKGAKSETTECAVAEYHWLGEESEGVFVCIDTPGLNDSEGGDEHHINDIIGTMKGLEYVNAIVLVLNGTEPRFSKSLQDAILRFEQAFCGETPSKVHANFYDNLIVCFQRWKMHEHAVAEREECSITEQGTAQDFCKQFREKFPHVTNRAHDLQCRFVDSHDRDPKRKAQGLLSLKQAIPRNVFRTGDLERIVPRLTGYDAAAQCFTQSIPIIPMKPRLVDSSVRVTAWSISPPLPIGLELCRETGVISGTPQTACAPMSYTVVAESLGGESKPCEIPNVEIRLSNAEVQSLVLKCKQSFEPLLSSLEISTDSDNLDKAILELEKVVHNCVSQAKAELEQKFVNMSQLNELIDKVRFAGNEMKTNHEIKLRKKYEKHAKAENEARLKLEKLDHEVQRLLLTCIEDHPTLERQINQLARLEPAAGTSAATTLEKARQWLVEIEPTRCTFPGCPHIGLRRNQKRHADFCLFNLPLITQSAVQHTATGDCSLGFKLTATKPEFEEYSGDFKPGPSEHMDDDQEGWFHWLDRSNQRIIRIKYVSQRWVLTSWDDPDDETEILIGSESQKVEEADLEGFIMTPMARLAWKEDPACESLAADSIKLMYFGGMWCPYCPPFTKRLKIFFDIVREAFGQKIVEVIFVSSDEDENEMLEYYGGHHGDWFALPYKERTLDERLSQKFGVQGIPSLHVIGNDGEEVEFFKKGGGGDIRKAIRNLPESKADAKGAVIQLFKTLRDYHVPEQQGFLGVDYEHIILSAREVSVGESFHANLLGDIKDLKSGKFADAARGLRAYLKVDDDWKEEIQCTVKGMEDEVRRLMNCPDCTALQASVLEELNRKDEAEACRNLAIALQSLKSQEKLIGSLTLETLGAADQVKLVQLNDAKLSLEQERQRVHDIREGIKGSGGWYYGCDSQSVEIVEWPKATIEHAYGAFRQPLCEHCKRYRLDYTTISEDLDYVLHRASSVKKCFNGVRDDGRPGMTFQDFMKADEAMEAKLTEGEVAGLRFYTSHSFGCINEPLRHSDRLDPHPLPAIATNIQNGLKKLRSLGAEEKGAMETVMLWRGFRDTQSTDIFMEAGGTELAPMSTTTDVGVAVAYAVRNSQTGRSLLFRIVTENNLQRGADLRWLSMFPGEAETLYPPLTYLQPTGRRQVVKVDAVELTVVEVKATLS